MKKGVEYTGKVVGLTFPNKGKVDCGEEGMAVVKGTVPGQTVKFVVSKKRSGNAIGRLKEVVEKSELEDVSPKCPHFEFCGGCSYQTMSYDNQLKLKKDTVKGILDNAINESYEFQGILQSPLQWEYRNKMEFSFGDEVKDGPLALGMHKRNSFHDIVTVDECQIVDSDYRKILDAVLEFCAGKELPFYKKLRHEGYLRHLLVRRTTVTKQLLVAVVTTSDKEMEEKANWTELVEILKNLDLSAKLCGVIHIINDGLADVVQSDETRILFGDEYIYEELLGLRFKISVFSFFQTNSLGAEVLYSKAREYIGDTKDMTVFDLYSGTGTIAQIIAPVAKKVVGVEIVEEAVEAAKVNAGLNGLDNCEFIAGDVLKVIDEIEDKPDMIILDPPRDGINPKALQKIIDFGVNNLVYISCKPTSLARDLEMLQEQGYRVEKACAVDMFPNTVHVETVVLLSQQKPDDTIEIDLDLDELDATSAETKATYQEIKDYVLKEFGLKVSNLYISQIKRKCGIEVGENYNLPKTENPKVPQCPKEKEDAIKAALKYFAMI
ncbi:23S rRNA (uracil(1939)-C(5))-methyltransferase RlmD [Eubacterium sp. AF36-5BH]|uniref:23S rRNA (uracil(1939)-C(5))-methyltransferase RlmD n=1 Tax=Eubacterium sp. AF36-5BH TaxID=2293108 RepID=UPI000E523E5F|nr:23S rRNA (uracil(1939)-C(5))-methyltransferase RlmD [Eubacterium sp. AF36-5BH]RGF52887.1 23S rRNA (uracil(1939)-C(5))-methyltransferase RlmD [Eubacterium sp. AF36-5BH]